MDLGKNCGIRFEIVGDRFFCLKMWLNWEIWGAMKKEKI